MANTYTLITSNTLSSSTANVTFSSIPATYTDLKVSISARSAAGGADSISMQINSVTTGYSQRALEGNGSSASSFSQSGGTTTRIGIVNGTSDTTANTFSSTDFYVPNYTSANAKSISSDSTQENNASLSYMNLIAYLNTTTQTINELKFFIAGGNSFAANSSFYLYGIKNS